MKVGLFYLFREFGDVPQDRIFSEVLEEIDYGEELGFDSVWLPEHHFSVYGTLGCGHVVDGRAVAPIAREK